MKYFLTIIVLTLFYSIHTFSQDRNHTVVLPNKINSGKTAGNL